MGLNQVVFRLVREGLYDQMVSTGLFDEERPSSWARTNPEQSDVVERRPLLNPRSPIFGIGVSISPNYSMRVCDPDLIEDPALPEEIIGPMPVMNIDFNTADFDTIRHITERAMEAMEKQIPGFRSMLEYLGVFQVEPRLLYKAEYERSRRELVEPILAKRP